MRLQSPLLHSVRALARLLPVVPFVALPALAQSELDQYLAERRAAAMTEGAEGQIRTVANTLAGASALLVEKNDDGSFVRSYSTALCLRRGTASPEQQKLKAEIEQRAAAEFQRLKSVADFDHSGFVTAPEGTRLREVVELGLVVEQLPAEDTATTQALAKALQRDEPWVTATAAAYEQLRLDLSVSQGAKLPELPRALLAAPASTPTQKPR